MVSVAVVVPVVVLHWHGAQRDPPPLLLLPLEVAVVELEVLRLHRLRQRQLLGVTDLWNIGREDKRLTIQILATILLIYFYQQL